MTSSTCRKIVQPFVYLPPIPPFRSFLLFVVLLQRCRYQYYVWSAPTSKTTRPRPPTACMTAAFCARVPPSRFFLVTGTVTEIRTSCVLWRGKKKRRSAGSGVGIRCLEGLGEREREGEVGKEAVKCADDGVVALGYNKNLCYCFFFLTWLRCWDLITQYNTDCKGTKTEGTAVRCPQRISGKCP